MNERRELSTLCPPLRNTNAWLAQAPFPTGLTTVLLWFWDITWYRKQVQARAWFPGWRDCSWLTWALRIELLWAAHQAALLWAAQQVGLQLLASTAPAFPRTHDRLLLSLSPLWEYSKSLGRPQIDAWHCVLSNDGHLQHSSDTVQWRQWDWARFRMSYWVSTKTTYKKDLSHHKPIRCVETLWLCLHVDVTF